MGFENKSPKDTLNKSEKFFQKMFENAPSNIIITDENGNIIECNKNAEQIANAPREDIIGKNFLEFFIDQPETKEFLKKRYLKYIKKGILDNFEFALKDDKLNTIWLKVEPSIFKFDDKTLIQIVFFDITKKKLTKIKLKESERKYREVLDFLPDIVFELNKNLNLIYLNKTGIRNFGYTQEEYDHGLNLIEMISPKDIERAFDNMKKFIEGGEISSTDYLLRKKDGTEFWGRVRSQLIEKNGKVVGVEGIITDITRQKEFKEKLEESEEKFREISEQSLMGISILQDNSVKYVNQKFADTIGYTVEEMMNWKPSEYIKTVHPDDRKRNVELATRRQLGDGNVISHYETRAIKKTGEIIWLEIFSKSILFGGKYADLVMMTDISEKKIAEQKLKESEEKYRLISENASDMIGVLNRKFEYEYINEKIVMGTVGYSNNDVIGKSPIEFVHPADLEVAVSTFKTGFEKGEGGCTLRFKNKKGKYIWLEIKGRTFRDINGEKKALIFSRDISEKIEFEKSRKNYTKDLEIEVERKTKDLLEEKKMVESIINTISDGILVLNQNGKLLLINNTLKEYYNQIYFRNFPNDFSYSSKPNNIFDETIRRLFLSKKPNNITIEPKEGNFFQLVSIGIGGSENSVLGSIIEVRDVTPFIEFDTMRRHFVSTVTHELRTPISALMQSIENLEDYKDRMSEEMQNKLIETMAQNVKLLSELVEDLLFLSKIEERKIDLDWKKFYPYIIIKEILNQVEPHRVSKNIIIDLDIDESIYLFGDVKRIGQIFRILIDNALKYSNRGTNVKIIVINNYTGKFNPQNEKGVLFQIRDSGLGIQQKDIPHLFKRFFRSEEVRNIPGTGLGLAIARELAQLHLGEIFVESDFGKGSTFSLFLPRLEKRPLVNYK